MSSKIIFTFSTSWHSESLSLEAEPNNSNVGTDVSLKLGSVLNGHFGLFHLQQKIFN